MQLDELAEEGKHDEARTLFCSASSRPVLRAYVDSVDDLVAFQAS